MLGNLMELFELKIGLLSLKFYIKQKYLTFGRPNMNFLCIMHGEPGLTLFARDETSKVFMNELINVKYKFLRSLQ